MTSNEGMNNIEVIEVSKKQEHRGRTEYPESVTQILNLKSKVNGIVFQRLKDKVNEDQLKEVSTKVVELSEIFEKLLQDSGYEKPVFVKRHAPYRRRFNNKKVKTPSGKNEQESSKNDSNEENINYSIPKKVTKKGNHSKSYKKFNNKHGKIGDKEVEEKSGENQKETNNSKKTKGKRPIKSKLTQSNA